MEKGMWFQGKRDQKTKLRWAPRRRRRLHCVHEWWQTPRKETIEQGATLSPSHSPKGGECHKVRTLTPSRRPTIPVQKNRKEGKTSVGRSSPKWVPNRKGTDSNPISHQTKDTEIRLGIRLKGE